MGVSYHNRARFHQGLAADPPEEMAGAQTPQQASLHNYLWQSHCNGLFELPIAACARIRYARIHCRSHELLPIPSWAVLFGPGAPVLFRARARSGPGAQAAARNLCPNPGFERLNPAGDNFPIGWGGPFNAFIDKDAHGGSIAIRLSCKADERASLNSQTMAVRRGVLTFFYKAVRSGSGGDNLRMCVIGLNQQGSR